MSCLSSPLTSLNHLLSTYSDYITPYVISIFQSILALFHEIDESSEFIDETLSELQQFSEQGEITERKNECLNILYNLYDIEFKQNQLELCKQIESQLLPFIKVWTVLKNWYVDFAMWTIHRSILLCLLLIISIIVSYNEL